MTGYKSTQIRKPSEETEFEKQSVVLFREILKDPNVKRVGRRGQGQFGVDVVGRRNGNVKSVVGIQCKCKGDGKELTEKEVRTEVARALKFSPRLSEYPATKGAQANDVDKAFHQCLPEALDEARARQPPAA